MADYSVTVKRNIIYHGIHSHMYGKVTRKVNDGWPRVQFLAEATTFLHHHPKRFRVPPTALSEGPNIVRVIKSRRMRWVGHVARMGEGRGVYMVLVGRPEGKRPLGRPRDRWEDNIKMDLREIGIDGANWIQMAQDMVQWRACMNTVMNLRVPQRKQDIF
jgi:hypothetical protein